MLRDYQNDIATKGCAILRSYGLLYLSMEVRTGKTLTALACADLMGARRVLLLTKLKALPSIKRDYDNLAPAFDLYAVNYEQVHTLKGERYDLIILDEAHSLGQYPKPSERTKLVKEIATGTPIIYLSGTPTPESFSQLFHQLWVSGASPFAQFPNFYKWAADYVEVRQRRLSHGLVNDYSRAHQQRVEAATKHLFISFSQADAGFTSEVEEHIITIPMRPSTYVLADRLRERRIVRGKGGEEILADTEVKLMQKLHQIYSGTIIPEGTPDPLCFDDSKARYISDHFKGQKIAIFYKFRGELALLHMAFPGRLTDSPEAFRASDTLVFASQIQSGREGINLSSADCLIFFNIDFSHVSYLQARARLQTKDRAASAPLYWLFAEGGIEQHIYERVKAKQDYQLAYFREDYKKKEVAA